MSHVHRGRAQPQFAARHPAARKLSRRRKGQEAHPAQSQRLVAVLDRGPARAAQGRRRAAARPGRHHHQTVAAARPCRGRARDLAKDRPRPPTRSRRQSLPRSRHRHDRDAADRPLSKLATAKALDPMTAASSLGSVLGLGEVDEDELYTALDWLLERQPQIEAALAKRHLKNGTLVLYDVSSSYLEGRCCELGQLGYNRDGKRGKLQIVYGLLCAADGCPVAVEVFEGSTGDPATLATQIDKLKRRFDLAHVVLVGDRGMITQARLDQDIKPAGLDWITALRAPQIRALLDAGAFQLSLFDERDLASITADDYPGERLIVCRNPDLARARRLKREDLLSATERELAAIHNAVHRATKPLRGNAEIGLRVGAVIGKYKMAKHFTLTITDSHFAFTRKHDEIDAEARLDGIYVIRTSLAAKTLDDSASVRAYKSLAQVERAIRSIKTVDLQIRPIFHWAAPRVRAHVCLCMLAYHVEWHMRQRLAPMLYDDADKDAAEALRSSVVAKAQRSPAAVAKQTYGATPDGLPVHSFQSLLNDLATLAQNSVVTALNPNHAFVLHTRPTKIQEKAFRLLGIDNPACTQ